MFPGTDEIEEPIMVKTTTGHSATGLTRSTGNTCA
jgi:hypothetical protein